MGRLRHETQRSVNEFFGEDTRPDDLMHLMLDEVKDLEVDWFTSDNLERVAEGVAKVQVLLLRVAGSVDISVQAEIDAHMRDLRKEA